MNKQNLLSLLTVALCFWFSAGATLFAQEATEVEIPLLPKEPIIVIVEGVEGEELKNVQATLALPPGLVSDGKVDRLWLERFQRQIPEKVSLALEPFGYYESGVTVSLEEVDEA
ncbi:MAG: POTRA domain-containing protein, partial [Thermodesulfobacteriota bacterium]